MTGEGTAGPRPKRVGRVPVNHLNDLAYRDWMKFQKSFFHFAGTAALVDECVRFFTKAVWPDGTSSRALVVTAERGPVCTLGPPRIVAVCVRPTLRGVLDAVQDAVAGGQRQDFALLDLRTHLRDEAGLGGFLAEQATPLFEALSRLLHPTRYAGILVGSGCRASAAFPLAWSVATAARAALRLRDEKVALVDETGDVFTCLFVQREAERRRGTMLAPGAIRVAGTNQEVPAWLAPASPRRARSDALHPAKFPEALIERFVEVFTRPGDSVLDPMAGTGSALVAAVRLGRHGYGVELSERYASIAAQRVGQAVAEAEQVDQGGAQVQGASRAPAIGVVVQGDALQLGTIPELVGRRFQYCVTSPPYWTMLGNPGNENQRARRKKRLPLVYSADPRDLGNVADYDTFFRLLRAHYEMVATKLAPGGHLTVIVKNVKRQHTVYPLAWDLVAALAARGGVYEYVGHTLWCQGDVSLKPFAIGSHWVSNTLHQYCLHFRRTDVSS